LFLRGREVLVVDAPRSVPVPVPVPVVWLVGKGAGNESGV